MATNAIKSVTNVKKQTKTNTAMLQYILYSILMMLQANSVHSGQSLHFVL